MTIGSMVLNLMTMTDQKKEEMMVSVSRQVTQSDPSPRRRVEQESTGHDRKQQSSALVNQEAGSRVNRGTRMEPK